MEKLYQLEKVIASWHKNLPHLPENIRKWIAENIWWLTLIGVILGGFGACIVLMALMTGAAIMSVTGSFTPEFSGAMLFAAFLTLLFATANVVVAAVAISPLKSLRKFGWSLLFVAAIINVVSLVVTFLFNYSFFNLLYGLAFAAVGAYFLFEIRGYFHQAKRRRKPAAKKMPRRKMN